MKESVRIFRFIVIGTMNALIMALVVWLMMREMSFEGDYMVANVTAYVIAQIHNFIWCKYWIFPVEKRKNNVWKQILFFCSAFGVAYTAQFLFLVLLVEGLDVNEYLAQFLGFFVKFGGNLFFISPVFFFLNPIKSCRYVCFLVTLKTPHH